MSFAQAEKRLLALGDEVLTMKFGLRNMRTLLRALGSPHRKFRSIHVAGTNGKGSVCAMLDSVLRAGGFRVGLFTSPHLVSIRERLRVDGTNISPQEFARTYQRVTRAIRRLRRSRHLQVHPTYFETITAMAFDFFAQKEVEAAVIEVGMGGRLDSTNCITPLVSVITNIDFDHERFLGESIEAIAREKAGIIKPRVPVVTAARRPEARRVIRSVARSRNAPVHDAPTESRVSKIFSEATGSRFTLRTPQTVYKDLEIPLAGWHQIENAVIAVRTLEIAGERGLMLTPGTIVRGLRSVRWPGRFEKVSRRPEIYLDGAHNPAGARSLRKLVTSLLPHRKVILVYGAMRDKKIRRVFRELAPLAHHIIFTRPAVRRAATAEEIFGLVGEQRWGSFLTASASDALRLARRLAKSRAAILVSGSLYLVGEVRKILLGTT